MALVAERPVGAFESANTRQFGQYMYGLAECLETAQDVVAGLADGVGSEP